MRHGNALWINKIDLTEKCNNKFQDRMSDAFSGFKDPRYIKLSSSSLKSIRIFNIDVQQQFE